MLPTLLLELLVMALNVSGGTMEIAYFIPNETLRTSLHQYLSGILNCENGAIADFLIGEH